MNTVPAWLRTNLGCRDNLVTRPTVLATFWSDIRPGTLALVGAGPATNRKATTAARNQTLL
jgi:hypothetical protein